MNILSYFRRLWNARQLPASAAVSHSKTEGTDRMLLGLQQLCATLPQGEAEVWLGDGQVNIALHWIPEEKRQGHPGEKAQAAEGVYFLLNGQNKEVKYAEWKEEKTDGLSLIHI